VKLFRKNVIGPAINPLLIRYILIRFEPWGIYLHHLMRSDYDRALHDHPWPFISIILRGSYTEIHDQTLDGSEAREEHRTGSVLIRPAQWRHRFLLTRPAWTLVIVGRRCRRWGFFPAEGWCWWRKFNSDKGICEEQVLWTEGKD
jgi:hypothetical protein